MKWCGVVILVVLIAIVTSFAQDSLNVTMVKRLYTHWDNLYKVEASGNYVYVPDGSGLWIVDASDPENPKDRGRSGRPQRCPPSFLQPAERGKVLPDMAGSSRHPKV